MSASGTLFLQSFVFLHGTRILGSCQEIRDLLAYGWRRRLPAIDSFKTSSATVAEACSSTKKLAIDGYGDCAQVRSCNAGDTNHPTRRAVRKTLTHAKTCQLIHKTPKIREQAVVAAHAEAKTVVKTTTRTVAAKMGVSPAVAAAILDAKARANPSSNAVPCPLPPSSAGGRNSSTS
jgi:hypothetical protein